MTVYKKTKSVIRPDKIRFDEKNVWVSENVTELQVEQNGVVYTEYEFDVIRYTKDEYIKLIDAKNRELERQLTDTQLALCEIYEGVM